MQKKIIPGDALVYPNLPRECGWCSNGSIKTFHYGPCPRVKSIEYNPDGTVKRVEFRDS